MNKIYLLKQIETPRLILRPVQLGDEIAINKAIHNSLILLQKWQEWAKDPSIESTRNFVQRGVFAWDSNCVTDFPMVVIHKIDQKIIGASGYNDQSDIEQGVYEIGYWCDKDYQGQGLVTEYANALTRYALEQLSATKVVISMQVENKKSLAVAERLNFMNLGIKNSSLLDEVSGDSKKSYIYVINDTAYLPSLKVSWTHQEKDTINSRIIAWAKEKLNITDSKNFASNKTIVKTPWSTVWEINAANQIFFLKRNPKIFSVEPKIIQTLEEKFHASVPSVIAENIDLNSFLMKNAGKPLREILKKQFDLALLSKAIDQFAKIQISVADHINIFLEIGVPDWRLDKLPRLYEEFLMQKEILLADGFKESEISKLKNSLPKIYYLCEKLSHHSFKPTMVQCDFHDNNVLIDDEPEKITHIDLGEIVISHPFFSLIGCLRQIKKHYLLTDNDEKYLKLKNTFLKNYTQFSTEKDLTEAFSIVSLLWFVYEALAQYRLFLACGEEEILTFQPGKLRNLLKEFITIF